MPTWPDFRDAPDLREMDNTREMTSEAIQSQYAASVRVLDLAEGFQLRLDPTEDIDLFYNKIFNILTAEGPGLDAWGVIVAMPRTIDDPDTGRSITLDDEYYRLLLLYKAMANISPSDAHSLNSLLQSLVDTGIAAFPRLAYVLEVDTMVIRWVFEDFLNDMQLLVFKAAGTLARGGGVGWELYAVDPQKVFGFDQSLMQPFNQAPFAPDAALVMHRS